MEYLSDIVSRYAEKNMADIRNEWSKENVKGNAEIRFKITREDVFGVTGQYEASGQKAWIVEHGSGSLMDDASENPGLSQYKSSKYWNDEREGTEIRTRTGEYSDLDDNMHTGSGLGGSHGLNAEKLRGGRKVVPHEPRHVLKETLTSNTVINLQMKDAILRFVGDTVKTEMRRVR